MLDVLTSTVLVTTDRPHASTAALSTATTASSSTSRRVSTWQRPRIARATAVRLALRTPRSLRGTWHQRQPYKQQYGHTSNHECSWSGFDGVASVFLLAQVYRLPMLGPYLLRSVGVSVSCRLCRRLHHKRNVRGLPCNARILIWSPMTAVLTCGTVCVQIRAVYARRSVQRSFFSV